MKTSSFGMQALFASLALVLCNSEIHCDQNQAYSSSLQKLIDGNKRYTSHKALHPNQTPEVRMSLTSGQNPFAVVVCCSDSRVPPEVIFDQGLGDLFVVRVAGNVVGPIERDSIEYAAEILHSPLIVVLGHSGCGAVQAVIKGEAYAEDIPDLAPYIRPAVITAEKMPGDTLTNAIKENVKNVIEEMKVNPKFALLIQQKKLEITGGVYDLETGKVTLID